MKKRTKRIIIALGIISVIVIVIVFKINSHNYSYGKNNLLENLTYKNPEGFEKDYSYDNHISYSHDGDDIYCFYSIDADDYQLYKDGKSYLEERFDFTLSDRVSEIKEEIINDVTWYSIKKESTNGNITYNYVTVKNDNRYILDYRIWDYDHGDYGEDIDNFCFEALDEIVASLEIK